jgi:predicted DNA-binding protein with PD1-like motif
MKVGSKERGWDTGLELEDWTLPDGKARPWQGHHRIGALMEADLAYYDLSSHEYRETSIDEPAELVYCSGNVSIRDGHLIRGNVFAAELCLHELLGATLERLYDEITGLYLWDEP